MKVGDRVVIVVNPYDGLGELAPGNKATIAVHYHGSGAEAMFGLEMDNGSTMGIDFDGSDWSGDVYWSFMAKELELINESA